IMSARASAWPLLDHWCFKAPARRPDVPVSEQAMTAHFVASRFHYKSAPPAADEGVNLPKQVFGQDDVGASRHSVCI
ncbi:MAG: hypothetical protein WBC78_13975, partial [Candidatus Sulfotelmatobacter sp.]